MHSPSHLPDLLRGLQHARVSEGLLPGLQVRGPQLHPEHVNIAVRGEGAAIQTFNILPWLRTIKFTASN